MKPAKELAIAALGGDVARVRQILHSSPDAARDWQPIMDACFMGRPAIVRILLAHGADANVISKSTYRYRPLHRTVEHKQGVRRGPEHLEVVEVLLAGGADVTARGRWDDVTAIAVAAMGGETQFLPLLLEKAPAERDIFTAAVLCDQERVSALLGSERSLATVRDENGWQALAYCARSRALAPGSGGHIVAAAIARELLAHGADAQPVLGPAIGTDNAPLVELLLDRGAVLDSGDALVHAAEGCKFAALDVLRRRGADLQCTLGTEHHGGYTPLGCLMTIRSSRGARWFLQQGIDPNEVGGENGETALHVAVRHGCSPDTLKLLVEYGVRVDAPDRAGRTALAIAREKGAASATMFLQGLGAGD